MRGRDRVGGKTGLSKPFFSFIIPTFNSERTIGKCLSSIPVCGEMEVIVVDNFSSDSTVSIARRHNVKIHQLRSTVAKARNYAAERSRGEYVVRLDSDEVLSRPLGDEIIRVLKKHKPDVAFAPRVEQGHWLCVIDIMGQAHHYYEYGPSLQRKGAVIAYRRSLFLKFRQNEKLNRGEDTDQMERMSPHIKTSIILKNPFFHLPITLNTFLVRTIRQHKLSPSQRYEIPLALRVHPRHRIRALRFVTRYRSFLYTLKHWPMYFPSACLLEFISVLVRRLPRRVLKRIEEASG